MQIEKAVKIVKGFLQNNGVAPYGSHETYFDFQDPSVADNTTLTAISVLMQHSDATRDIAKQFFEASRIVSRN